jgi:hypothetical protein
MPLVRGCVSCTRISNEHVGNSLRRLILSFIIVRMVSFKHEELYNLNSANAIRLVYI